MGNGSSYALPPDIQASSDGDGAPARPFITINQISLTWRQIGVAIAGIPTVAAFLVTSGWLFMPAKEKDFSALRDVVTVMTRTLDEMQSQTQANRTSIGRLTEAVDNLSNIVSELKNAPPRTIERFLPRPVVGKAKR